MLDCLTDINRLRMVAIQEVVEESPTVKTLTFEDKFCSKAKAGQFMMVWIPGVDEVPMSLSTIDRKRESSITVARVGEATERLQQKKPGDLLGIRGPFGNGFTLASGEVMIVGGGTGSAALTPLAENLAGLDTRMTFLLGAKTKDELLLLKRITDAVSKVHGRVIATTEDGSHGLKGVVTRAAEEVLEKKRFDMIYTCGREQMMYQLFLLAGRYSTPFEASLERIMRCGIGVCGSCVMGEFRVCKDGPVLSYEQLMKVQDEFGKFARDFSGKKISV